MTLKQNKTEGKSVENGGKKGEKKGEGGEKIGERGEKRGEGGEGELLELSMDTWLTVCKEDELPQVEELSLCLKLNFFKFRVLRNLSRVLNLRRGSNMFGFT